MVDATRDTDETLQRFQMVMRRRLNAARHRGPLFRYFKRQCEMAAAEELYQDVWMRIVRAKGYTPRPFYLFYRIAHNRLSTIAPFTPRKVSLQAEEDSNFEPAEASIREPDATAARQEQ